MMSVAAPTSDADILDLLRVSGSLGVTNLAEAIEVTPTAVRQRLMRMMAQGLVERESVNSGRGRPRHLYQLTDQGLRLTGSNFADLAVALWQEMGLINGEETGRRLVRRVAESLVANYADQVQGVTAEERMQSLAELFSQWRIPVSVEGSERCGG